MGWIVGAPRTSRRTVEDLPVLNIHRMRRAGTILPGDTAVTVAVNGAKHRITLAFRPGTLGGEVALFICPQCNALRWHVYLLNEKVGCRGCLGLGYARHWCRAMPMLPLARRLRQRLGASLEPFTPLPPRPFHGGRAGARHDRLTLAIRTAEAKALTALDRMTNASLKAAERQRHKPDPDPSSEA
jgi:hypothetical protein